MIGSISCGEDDEEILSGDQNNTDEEGSNGRMNQTRGNQEDYQNACNQSCHFTITKISAMGILDRAIFSVLSVQAVVARQN